MRQRYFYGNETGMLIWDVDAVLKEINEHPNRFELRLVDTDYIAEANSKAAVNQKYAMKTDLKRPCVLAEVKNGHYLLLDGNHRLYKALKEKKTCMMCYCLKEKQHKKFIEHFRQHEYECILGE